MISRNASTLSPFVAFSTPNNNGNTTTTQSPLNHRNIYQLFLMVETNNNMFFFLCSTVFISIFKYRMCAAWHKYLCEGCATICIWRNMWNINSKLGKAKRKLSNVFVVVVFVCLLVFWFCFGDQFIWYRTYSTAASYFSFFGQRPLTPLNVCAMCMLFFVVLFPFARCECRNIWIFVGIGFRHE